MGDPEGMPRLGQDEHAVEELRLEESGGDVRRWTHGVSGWGQRSVEFRSGNRGTAMRYVFCGCCVLDADG